MTPGVPGATDARVGVLAGDVLAVGLAGTLLGSGERARLREMSPAGIILFARNVDSTAQLQALCEDLRQTLDDPLLLIDQEGGRVDRLRSARGASRAARELARIGAEEVGAESERTARELRMLGVNFNCAPVVDLDEGREENAIGDRCLGTDPWDVAELAGRIVDAHARHGIATCLKHFPGLGRTGVDTHVARPSVEASRADLEARELVPFRALLGRCPAIMVGHAAVPGLTGDDVPASLAPAVVTDLLRHEMGFDGLIVSDDLAMGAVADRSAAAQAVEAISAGCDLLLYCQPTLDAAEEARAAIVARAATDGAFRTRLDDAGRRVGALRRALARARAGTDPLAV